MKLTKGNIVINRNGWVSLVIENMRGSKSETVMCHVFGYSSEAGSVYAREFQPFTVFNPDGPLEGVNRMVIERALANSGYSPDDLKKVYKRFIKKDLITN
jgi:hypothetical protein